VRSSASNIYRIYRKGRRRILSKFGLGCSLLLHRGFVSDVGWSRSAMEGLPVDKDGNPLPWYTYSCIHFLQARLSQEMSVFEYGCGYSTLWWAARVSRVVSCEQDRGWYTKVKKVTPPNVHLYHIAMLPGGEYCRFICNFTDEFDIVVIDGRDRVNCAKNCLSALRLNGVIIWDNADRPRYREGYDYLLRHGYNYLDFWGMGPINPYAWTTRIFYKDDNCLAI